MRCSIWTIAPLNSPSSSQISSCYQVSDTVCQANLNSDFALPVVLRAASCAAALPVAASLYLRQYGQAEGMDRPGSPELSPVLVWQQPLLLTSLATEFAADMAAARAQAALIPAPLVAEETCSAACSAEVQSAWDMASAPNTAQEVPGQRAVWLLACFVPLLAVLMLAVGFIWCRAKAEALLQWATNRASVRPIQCRPSI